MKVSGRVVDPDRLPTANATVAAVWTANGHTNASLRELRNRFGEDEEALITEMYRRTGEMRAFSPSVRTNKGGFFRFRADGQSPVRPQLVFDAERCLGAILLRPDVSGPNEVQLRPLIRVQGRVQFERKDFRNWSMVDLYVPPDNQSPLRKTHIAMCGSLDGHFEFWVPPGTYYLHARTDDGLESSTKQLVTDRDRDTGDVGVIELRQVKRLKELAQEGDWRMVSQRIGEPSPELHLTDARGLRIQEGNVRTSRHVSLGHSDSGCALLSHEA